MNKSWDWKLIRFGVGGNSLDSQQVNSRCLMVEIIHDQLPTVSTISKFLEGGRCVGIITTLNDFGLELYLLGLKQTLFYIIPHAWFNHCAPSTWVSLHGLHFTLWAKAGKGMTRAAELNSIMVCIVVEEENQTCIFKCLMWLNFRRKKLERSGNSIEVRLLKDR